MNRPVLAAALAMSTALATPAVSETVLRLDEVPVGELDPAKATDYADNILMFNVYDTLVLPNQGGPGHQPHLASGWSVDDTGTVYTFTLRDDVKFESGNPMTAADVVFSLDRMRAIGKGFSYLFDNVETIKAVGDDTVEFTLKAPAAPFLSSLMLLPIVDKALVMDNLGDGDGEMGDWGEAFLSADSAGTGAYSVTSHNPQDETVMAKNPGYFLGVPDGAPDVARLRYGLEPATVRTLIAQGEHDISSQWIPPEVARAIAENGGHLLSESGTSGFYMKMNTQKAPLDDVNCRRALAAAFDYATALQIVAVTDDVSLGRPSTGAIPVGMFGANPADAPLTRDMEAAKAFLAECPYDPAEWNLEISWIAEVPVEERFALMMQANFAELGISSEIVKVPWALFTELVTDPERTPHISQLFTNALSGDIDTLLYPMYHSSVAGTWQSPEYLNDPEVDQLLDAGRAATDDAERQEIYTKLNARLMELAPTIYVYDRNSVFAASPRVSVPAMSDPDQAFGLDGIGFSFRLMEVEG